MTTSELDEEQCMIEYGRKLFAGQCQFIIGAQTIDQIPDSPHMEVAFCGLSNVGKSSLINALTGQKALARTSQTPGRTQQINFFLLRDALVLVDLPGYGYAKTSKKTKEAWGELITLYLKGRPNLCRVCILIDARRGVKDSDLTIMKMLDDSAVSYQIILTKSDTISAQELAKTVNQIQQKTKTCVALYPEMIATSSKNDINIDKLKAQLATLTLQHGHTL